MSLQNINLAARNITDLIGWFLDIYNHLSKDNYHNSEWTPTISNVTGTPTVKAQYTKFGQIVNFTIVLTGTFSFTNSVVSNLPFKATSYGLLQTVQVSSKTFVGCGYVNVDTKNGYLPNVSVTSDTVIIQGQYRVSGI